MKTYGPIQTDADIAQSARLLSLAFAGPQDKSEEWIRLGGVENMRVLRGDGDSILACLMRIPMGQYFGGTSVPVLGIAGVAVAPEARGEGLARCLMQECLKECAAEGMPLSNLYASTQELYRQVGYEQAGHRFVTTVPYSQMTADRRDAATDERTLTVSAARPEDEAEIRACYAAFARCYDGMLDRGPYVWRRTRQLREALYPGFVVRDAAGRLDGYVFLTQDRDAKTGRHDVVVSDYAFTTAQAGRKILSFLGNFGSMMHECVLPGGPLHPLAHLMSQQRFKVEKKDFWMVRVTDVPRAIAARGYNAAVEATVVLDIADDLIPANARSFEVRVSRGRGIAGNAGAARSGVRVGVRGLAAMYAGLVSARQCVALGWASGDEDSIDRANAIFPGGSPAMTDHF